LQPSEAPSGKQRAVFWAANRATQREAQWSAISITDWSALWATFYTAYKCAVVAVWSADWTAL